MAGPTKYNDDIVEEICNGVANGKSGIKVCRDVGIDYVTLHNWLNRYPDFMAKYLVAKEKCAEYYADEVLEISEEAPNLIANEFGGSRIDSGWVQNQKLKIEARKWSAGVLKPKRFAPKNVVEGEINVNHKLSSRLESASLIDVTPSVQSLTDAANNTDDSVNSYGE